LAGSSVCAGFVASLAGAPPPAPVSLEAGASLEELEAGVSLAVVEPDASLDLLEVLVVLVVEVVCAEAASALVFVGGVMSGVLFGTASETLALPPPHALRAEAHRRAAQPRSAALDLTTVPYACRTSGSR
jgi:hypothetical protein